MSDTWNDAEPPPLPPIGVAGWLRVALRGGLLGLLLGGGICILLVLRLGERPLCGARRPLTGRVVQGVCRASFAILGIGFRRQGRMMAQRGALVANHASWLDIFALNAAGNVVFVAKSEVASWPGIGFLARAAGTLFIRRDRREAGQHRDALRDRLLAGQKPVIFPEGTSTDGRRVLPFKSTLFEAFLQDDIKALLHIQPVTVIYTDPPGGPGRFYGWWGDMDFASHLVQILAARRQGRVDLVFGAPVLVASVPGRKALAQTLGDAVRVAFEKRAEKTA